MVRHVGATVGDGFWEKIGGIVSDVLYQLHNGLIGQSSALRAEGRGIVFEALSVIRLAI